MQSQIKHGTDFASLTIVFDAAGESVRVEAGAMIARDTSVQMQTSMRGGLGASLKRSLLGGESLFQNTFTATHAGQTLRLAPAMEGSIVEETIAEGQTIFLQSGAFVACTPTVQLDTKWGGAKGFFGAGLFLLKTTGPGTVWFSTYGALHAVELDGGEYVVDNAHLVAFDETLSYTIEKVGGLKSLLFSGEGLVCRLRGRGRVWIQTRSPGSLAWFLHPFRPVKAKR
ncbi:TIGR00266 family protein [Myxococcota bacterium]|nr:TIGR00266 family protein [Myxococcota bacterium]